MPLAERRAGWLIGQLPALRASLRRTQRTLRHAGAALLLAVSAGPLVAAPPALQPVIDTTPSGGTLRLAPGTYAGPVVIDRPMVVDGGGKARIDGLGKGTVITLRTNSSTLRGLVIVGSGDSHDRIDSAILIEGHHNRIEDNDIDDVLFGITLQQSNDNLVLRNRIRSRPADIADRGDGIRLWYGTGNRIEGNDIARIRDVTISNAPRNRYIGNRITDSRRAMNLLFAPRSLIEGNDLQRNATGITTLNSDGLIIRRNRIAHAMDASGAGIALKESSAVLIHENEILHCAVGILADSPLHALNRISIIGNRISHNVTGISFYGERGGHLMLYNRFEHNLWQATVGGDERNDLNVWYGNYWDDYEGFDRNGDGVGDSPYEIRAYADRIWIETPMARFFRSSPILELLDFLERLAPFSSPILILRDPAPVAHQQRKRR